MGRDMEKSGMIKGYIRTRIEFKALNCLLNGNQVVLGRRAMSCSFNKAFEVVKQWEFWREDNVNSSYNNKTVHGMNVC